MDALEALPIMQALYNVVKDEVATGKLGNTRSHAEQRLYDMFNMTDGSVKSMDLKVNGETVGALTATKKEGIVVTDSNLLRDWQRENGFIGEEEWFDWSALDDDERDRVIKFVSEMRPDLVDVREKLNHHWQDGLGHVGMTVIDGNGEVVQGVEWRTSIGQIRITGCAWAADPKKRTSKYVPVGEALGRAGLGFSQVMGLLGGDTQ